VCVCVREREGERERRKATTRRDRVCVPPVRRVFRVATHVYRSASLASQRGSHTHLGRHTSRRSCSQSHTHLWTQPSRTPSVLISVRHYKALTQTHTHTCIKHLLNIVYTHKSTY